MKNLFTDIPPERAEELVEILAESQDVRIERIISRGHTSPETFWYDQPRDEWVLLLKGAARLRFEEGPIEMRPGDWISIAAHRKHRVEWCAQDEATIWLAVHYR